MSGSGASIDFGVWDRACQQLRREAGANRKKTADNSGLLLRGLVGLNQKNGGWSSSARNAYEERGPWCLGHRTTAGPI